ncbi:hypothetical protein [Malaciobacter canalis]|uniref:hypothetical protein n=1 Tax=Malaciobacter canalis TaxID=1912871 RepID=UPI00384C3A4A
MTAEMGMLNKYAVALAADSAVTVTQNGESKVYNSANKLFKLSNFEPIGIMIYGNASFMGIPWETIIKLYRRRLKDTKFDLINEYADNFMEYLSKFKLDEENKSTYIEQNFYLLINEFFSDIENRKSHTTVKLTEWMTEYNELFDKEYSEIHEIKQEDYDFYKDKYISDIEDYFTNINPNYTDNIDVINKTVAEDFLKLIFRYIVINRIYNSSGVVIAGFGEEELYPALCSHDIDGKVGEVLIYQKIEEAKISIKNNAAIIPFAQTNMVRTFIQGINPRLETDITNEMKSNLNQLSQGMASNLQTTLGLSDDLTEEIEKGLRKTTNEMFFENTKKYLVDYKQQNHIVPIINTVALLEKDDLAHMAESLVNIASMDKKMSMEIESVGGPIDVAVISKGDGFIWYKRKHYFNTELNPDFIARKERQC